MLSLLASLTATKLRPSVHTDKRSGTTLLINSSPRHVECSTGVLTDLFNVSTAATTQARSRWREAIFASQHPADCARATLCTCHVAHGQVLSAVHGDAVCLLAAVLQNCTLVDPPRLATAKRNCEIDTTLTSNTAELRDCHLQKLSPCELAANNGAHHVKRVHVTQSSMVKAPLLAVPQLASCTSSGYAWRLQAARHSQGEVHSHGAPCHSASGAQASRLQSRRLHHI